MPEVPESVKVNIARGNWRADLLRVHASELRRIAGSDDSAVAASLLADADQKDAEADLHDTYATVEAEFAEAKAAAHADPANEKLHKRYQQAAQEITDMRATWRGIGEATGTRRFALTVDNFPEPADDEVLATHGKKA